MATKTAAKKTSSTKARTTKSAASTSAKKSAPVAKKSTASKKPTLPVSLYKEQNPEAHQMTGKFRVLFVVISAGFLVFACLSAYLYTYATDLLEKYQSVEICARANVSCKIRNNNSDENYEVIVEEAEE